MLFRSANQYLQLLVGSTTFSNRKVLQLISCTWESSRAGGAPGLAPGGRGRHRGALAAAAIAVVAGRVQARRCKAVHTVPPQRGLRRRGRLWRRPVPSDLFHVVHGAHRGSMPKPARATPQPQALPEEARQLLVKVAMHPFRKDIHPHHIHR